MRWKNNLIRSVHVMVSLAIMLPLLLCPSTLNRMVFGSDDIAIGAAYLALFLTCNVAFLIASCLDPGYLTHENARLFRHRRGQWSIGEDSKAGDEEQYDPKYGDGSGERRCENSSDILDLYGDVADGTDDTELNYFTRLREYFFICPNPITMFPRVTTFSANNEDPVVTLSIPIRFCRQCLLEQPLRCRHCPQCNRCVIKFDHHCPWIANCVGERNHCAFVTFLILQVVVLWWTVYFAWSSFLPRSGRLEWLRANGLYLAEIIVLMLIGMPLTILLTFHSYLALASRTTWETVAYERITYLRALEERTNPFNQGCARNCYAFCCSSYPFGWDRIYADATGQAASPTHTASRVCTDSRQPPAGLSTNPILDVPPAPMSLQTPTPETSTGLPISINFV